MATRISNPFYYGDLAIDEAFTDRQSELRALERAIEILERG